MNYEAVFLYASELVYLPFTKSYEKAPFFPSSFVLNHKKGKMGQCRQEGSADSSGIHVRFACVLFVDLGV